MFSKLPGYYTIGDLFAYLIPDRAAVDQIRKYLPPKNVYFFDMGREALYFYLLHRKSRTRKKHVILPSWGCPFLLSVVHKSGFIPLLMDIRERDLHMRIDDVIQVIRSYDVDSVLLVAENGILYQKKEIHAIQKEGVYAIGDHCVSWQNLDLDNFQATDVEFFSGGLSKPISGAGLGILTTSKDLPGEYDLRHKLCPSMGIKLLAHMILQFPAGYRILRPILRTPEDLNYNGKISPGSYNSLSIVYNSLKRVQQSKKKWKNMQRELTGILKAYGDDRYPASSNPGSLQHKLMFKKALLKEKDKKKHIAYHTQHAGINLLSDNRGKKIDNMVYSGTRNIQENTISMTLNQYAIQHQASFVKAFKKDIKNSE